MKLSVAKANLPVTQRICIYGPPKSGKTQLVSQLAEHFRLKWIDLENGMTPLLKLPSDWQDRIDLAKIPDTFELPIGIETMLKVVTGAKGTICAKHGKWNCAICAKDVSQAQLMTTFEMSKLGPRDILVVDSLTQVATSALNWIMRGKSDGAKPERDEWGQLKFIMEKFLSMIQQARYNVVCITHEDEVEMVNGKDKLVPVSGSRATSRNTAKYFDHVVYCNVNNMKHVFGSATTYAASVMAGSRLDVSIEKLEKPSLLPFFAHLLEFPLDAPLELQVAHLDEQPSSSGAVADSVEVSSPDETASTPVDTKPVLGNASIAAAALARIRAEREAKAAKK